MRILKWFAFFVGALVAFTSGVSGYARFQDGPVGFFAGGPFADGEPASSRGVDWSFLADVDTVELQLLEPARSRTVWIIYKDGATFIPCGTPNFRLWKQWPHEAVADGRARLRVDGRIFERTLVRVSDAGLHGDVRRLISEKYGTPEGDMESLWIFRLDDRPNDEMSGKT